MSSTPGKTGPEVPFDYRTLGRLEYHGLPGDCFVPILAAGISFDDLQRMTDEELLQVPGIGARRLAGIRAALGQLM